jgi:glycosyltransferase involved in cell wall biosynthesis
MLLLQKIDTNGLGKGKHVEYLQKNYRESLFSICSTIFNILYNENGFLVNSSQEWVEALEDLILNSNKRTYFGINGFKKIVNEYSTKSTAKLIIKSFNK